MTPVVRCTAATAGSCGEDGVILADFGCMHEHVDAAMPVCARHLAGGTGKVPGFYCHRCLGAGHACLMVAGNITALPG